MDIAIIDIHDLTFANLTILEFLRDFFGLMSFIENYVMSCHVMYIYRVMLCHVYIENMSCYVTHIFRCGPSRFHRHHSKQLIHIQSSVCTTTRSIHQHHCGIVGSAPACDGTGCEFDPWQCRIYIPCS